MCKSAINARSRLGGCQATIGQRICPAHASDSCGTTTARRSIAAAAAMADAEKKPEESKAEEEPVAGTLLACGATDWYSIGRRCAQAAAQASHRHAQLLLAGAAPPAAARTPPPAVAAAAGVAASVCSTAAPTPSPQQGCAARVPQPLAAAPPEGLGGASALWEGHAAVAAAVPRRPCLLPAPVAPLLAGCVCTGRRATRGRLEALAKQQLGKGA